MNQKARIFNSTFFAYLPVVCAALFGISLILNHIAYIIPMQNSGVHIQGVITNRSTNFSCSDEVCSDSHDVTYYWEVNGSGFSESVDDQSLYENYKIGDHIELIYLPNNPRSVLTTERLIRVNWVGQLILGILVIAGSIAYVIYRRLQTRISIKAQKIS